MFLFFALFVLLIGLGFFINDLVDFDETSGSASSSSFVLLVLLAAIAGFVAYRFFKKGAPPTPDMAIEEAKLTKAQFEHQGIERDQLGRSQDRPGFQEERLMAAAQPHPSRSGPRSRPPAGSWASRSTTCARRSPSSPTGARQLSENRTPALIGAAAAGFLIGGGVAATVSLFRRR